MASSRFLLSALLIGAGCAPRRPAAPAAPSPSITSTAAQAAPAPPPAPPGLRLPRRVEPERYTLEIKASPSAPTFDGQVEIELTVLEPTELLWLNARDLVIRAAELHTAAGARPLLPLMAPPEHVGFRLDPPLAPGRARLTIRYQGQVLDKDDRGVFREREGEQDYLFTQFESFEARTAVPCFDEPWPKRPWRVSLVIPEGLVGLANTQQESEERLPDGWKRLRFAETKPLPAYLLAFAVGPFELVEVGRFGRTKVPLRIATLRGTSERLRYTREVAGALFERVEGWFDVPYPYDKLDLVVIPRLQSFGAMENAGLITMHGRFVLAGPAQETPTFRDLAAVLLVHEVAHQWFGDLVTMEWWDDIWLNEAFASWMEGQVLQAWQPDAGWDVEAVRAASRAMRLDALRTARQVRQPVETADDILNAFDGITYQKGAAIIDMFSAYVGPETFRRGVKRYLERHAFGNATYRELLEAIDAVAERPISAAFSSFLLQPGVPEVRGELTCPKGQAPRIRLHQARYVPVGSRAEPSRWQIPLCVRYGGAASGRACTLLAEEQAELVLESERCPAWVLLNDGARGYYHTADGVKNLLALLSPAAGLSAPERAVVVRDLRAAQRSGGLTLGDLLGLLPRLARDPHPLVEAAVVDLVQGISSVTFPEVESPSYAAMIRHSFGPRARELGFLPRPGESDEVRELRPEVVGLVADQGQDPALVAEARRLAEAWLGGQELPQDSAQLALTVATRRAGAEWHRRLRELLPNEPDPARRAVLLVALRSPLDPAAVQDNLRLLEEGRLDPREAASLLRQDGRMARVVFAYVRERLPALAQRLPRELLGFLPMVGTNLCSEQDSAELEAFFAPRAAELPGSARNLRQAREAIELCTAARAHHQASLRAFLAGGGRQRAR